MCLSNIVFEVLQSCRCCVGPPNINSMTNLQFIDTWINMKRQLFLGEMLNLMHSLALSSSPGKSQSNIYVWISRAMYIHVVQSIIPVKVVTWHEHADCSWKRLSPGRPLITVNSLAYNSSLNLPHFSCDIWYRPSATSHSLTSKHFSL